jgi:hypothetical protein
MHRNQIQSYFTAGGLPPIIATSLLRLTTSNFIFKLNTCGYSPYVTSSLTREWVCRLQLLLVLASAVILRSESRGTHDHILLSQIRESPNLEGQVPVFISPRKMVAQLYPQTLGSNSTDHSTENTSPNSSIVASRSCRTDLVENTAYKLVHWCVLEICCLPTGVIYSIIT